MKLFYSLFLVASLLFTQLLYATPSIQTAFISEYTFLKKTALDSCNTCHMPIVDQFLNPYGLALKQSPLGFKKIEQLDSDGDGIKNIDEIKAKQNPGSRANAGENFAFNNPQGRVDFAHGSHVMDPAYLSKGNCGNCHGPALFAKIFDDSKSVQDLAHKVCVGCHKASGSGNAPQDCGDCHQ